MKKKILDIRQVADVSFCSLANDYPDYQKMYDAILCTDQQYKDLTSLFHDYTEDGNYIFRGIPLVTKTKPLRNTERIIYEKSLHFCLERI